LGLRLGLGILIAVVGIAQLVTATRRDRSAVVRLLACGQIVCGLAIALAALAG
jgi:hypothetical protein